HGSIKSSNLCRSAQGCECLVVSPDFGLAERCSRSIEPQAGQPANEVRPSPEALKEPPSPWTNTTAGSSPPASSYASRTSPTSARFAVAATTRGLYAKSVARGQLAGRLGGQPAPVQQILPGRSVSATGPPPGGMAPALRDQAEAH